MWLPHSAQSVSHELCGVRVEGSWGPTPHISDFCCFCGRWKTFPGGIFMGTLHNSNGIQDVNHASGYILWKQEKGAERKLQHSAANKWLTIEIFLSAQRCRVWLFTVMGVAPHFAWKASGNGWQHVVTTHVIVGGGCNASPLPQFIRAEIPSQPSSEENIAQLQSVTLFYRALRRQEAGHFNQTV